jgi:hypothetical protein
MDAIEALADCIMQFEGWKQPNQIAFPRGSTSWRNRNPGNLRASSLQTGVDDKGYATFSSLTIGWGALIRDLQAKFNGSHGLTPTSTLHDLFSIYAPSLDQNDPQQYSRQIALWLSKIYNAQVTPDWKLEDILKLGTN